MMVSQAGGGSVGARCPQSQVQERKPEKGQEDRGRGPVTRISKSECLPAPTPAPGGPRASFACENGEVDQPGMKEKKIESRGKEIVEATREGGKQKSGVRRHRPLLCPKLGSPYHEGFTDHPQPELGEVLPWEAGTVPSPGLIDTSPPSLIRWNKQTEFLFPRKAHARTQ